MTVSKVLTYEEWLKMPEGLRILRRSGSMDRFSRSARSKVLQFNDGKLTAMAIVNSGELQPKLVPEAAAHVAVIWED